MRARGLTIVGSIALLCTLAVATPALALKVTWDKTQVTTGDTDMVDARVSGTGLVWSTAADDAAVYFKRGEAAATALASGGPAWVSGDRVAWYIRNVVTGRFDLYTWKYGQGEPTLLETFANPRMPVAVDGDRVAWTGNVDSFEQPNQIFTWKQGDAQPTQVTTDTTPYAYWDVQVSGDRLAWYTSTSEGPKYYTWKVGDAQPRLLGTATSGSSRGPRVSGDIVVWSQWDGSYAQVWMWAAGDATSTQLTTDHHQHFYAAVDGYVIAYNQDNNGSKQVVFTVPNDLDARFITDYDVNCNNIEVSGSRVSWTMDSDEDGVQETLATWKWGDHSPSIVATNLTDPADVMNERQPFSLSGDRMTWIGQVTGVDQVFVAVPGAPADLEPPVTTSDIREFYSRAATITLTAVDDPDGLGVAHTYAVLDHGSTVETTSVHVTGMGVHTISYWSVDLEGNVEAAHDATFTIVDDAIAPTTSSNVQSFYRDQALIDLSAHDNPGGVGVATTYFAFDGESPEEYWESLEIRGYGTYTLRYWSVDKAGNVEATVTKRFTVMAAPASNGTPSKPTAPATVRHSRYFTVAGYVIRHTSGTRAVELQYYRYQSKHWVLRKSGTVKVSNFLTFSKFSGSVSVPLSGKWRVRARHKVGKTWRYSPYTYFTAS